MLSVAILYSIFEFGEKATCTTTVRIVYDMRAPHSGVIPVSLLLALTAAAAACCVGPKQTQLFDR